MERRALGDSGLEISALCLGTMTWGTQNDAADVDAQLSRALEAGVNFVDTAEMYPTTPRSVATFGDTERLLGRWLARTGRREEIVLATKVTGAGTDTPDGPRPITGEVLKAAFERSLERLRTDRIDLYQLHWPNRGSYHFRRHWGYTPSDEDPEAIEAHVVDVLRAADDLVREGRLGALGLSNDTAWGTAKFLEVARRDGLPRVASVQNEYSLLCRLFDTDMAELACRERVPLLAFSPLAAGMLSGKYEGGAVPEGSRRSIDDALGGRRTEAAVRACSAYVALAREHGLEPAAMALAWAMSRPFTGSVILGATTAGQLEVALSAGTLELSAEVLEGIDAVRREHPLPM